MAQTTDFIFQNKRHHQKLMPFSHFIKAESFCAGFAILFFLLVVSSFSNAQNTEIDSLKNILKDAPDDSLKVELLNKISYGLFTSNYEEAIEYGIKSKELADEINYPKGN